MEVINPRTGGLTILHLRVWHIIHKVQQHLLFQESDHYANFQQEHREVTAGFQVWSNVITQVGCF